VSKSNRIIVGVDGSKYSEKALDEAIELAKMHNAGLKIVHVFDGAIHAGDIRIPFERRNAQNILQIDEKSKKFFEELLKQYAEKALQAGIKDVLAKSIIVEGSAGAGLVLEAEDEGARMVVVGTRGLGGIRRMVLGSVANYVVSNCPCDVYVVKD